MADTKIPWCDKVVNVVTGCSFGCDFCWARRFHNRGLHGKEPFAQVVLHPERMEEPLRWKKPQRIFLCSMGDLFDPQVPDDFIDKVFGMMAICPHHQFIVLTKRPERMFKYMTLWPDGAARYHHVFAALHGWLNQRAGKKGWSSTDKEFEQAHQAVTQKRWPLPNVILGTSVATQGDYDERMSWVYKTPAALRCVSIEPMQGEIKLGLLGIAPKEWGCGYTPLYELLDWAICGAQSGPKPKLMDVAWGRKLVRECGEVGMPLFIKQLHVNGKLVKDVAQFPEDLRVQQFPGVRR